MSRFSRRAARFLRPVSAVTLAVMLLATAGLTIGANRLVDDQENRLIKERANEVALLLSVGLSNITTEINSLTTLVRSDGPSVFATEASSFAPTGLNLPSWALLRSTPSGYTVVSAVGPALRVGQSIDPVAAKALAAHVNTKGVVATPIFKTGGGRTLAFSRSISDSLVVYRQTVIGPVRVPLQIGNFAFTDLQVVLYAAPTADSTQVLTSTTSLPLHGTVKYVPFVAGQSKWLLGVSSAQPLVGRLSEDVPWAVMVAGLAVTGLVFAIMELVARRRDAAVALYQGEHRFAETMQRHLLPSVPEIAGLDIATRYVAASNNQLVGGDWFDVFTLEDGSTAVVIGDVVGHDVTAAQAMAQIRAALRAYAWEGDNPARVIERLGRLVEAFSITPLVTVLFGVVSLPDGRAARTFRWSNAGHLPPLLRTPPDRVSELRAGSAILLGAPRLQRAAEAEITLEPGATLVLYTDGLVERPTESLDDSIRDLGQVLRAQPDSATADEVCEAVLAVKVTDQQRDDVALFVLRTTTSGSAGEAVGIPPTANTGRGVPV